MNFKLPFNFDQLTFQAIYDSPIDTLKATFLELDNALNVYIDRGGDIKKHPYYYFYSILNDTLVYNGTFPADYRLSQEVIQ